MPVVRFVAAPPQSVLIAIYVAAVWFLALITFNSQVRGQDYQVPARRAAEAQGQSHRIQYPTPLRDLLFGRSVVVSPPIAFQPMAPTPQPQLSPVPVPQAGYWHFIPASR